MRKVQASRAMAALVALAAVPAAGEDIAAQLKAVQEKVETLKRKTRDPLRQQIAQRREALGKQPDMGPLRQALADAEKAYEEKKAADEAIRQARQASDAAAKALPQITKARLESHPKLQAIQSDIDTLRDTRTRLTKQREQTRRQLHDIRRQVEASPAFKKLRESIAATDKYYENLPKTHPTFVAARRAIDDARKALEARIRTLPEKKALDAAEKTYAAMMKNSPLLAQARQARTDVRKAYEQEVEKAVRTCEPGAAAYQSMEEMEQQYDEAEGQYRVMLEESQEARREVEKSDPEIAKAREAYEQARREYEKARHEHAADERKAVEEARRALEKRLQDKAAQDVLLMDLADRLGKVEKEIAGLYRQYSELNKKRREVERR